MQIAVIGGYDMDLQTMRIFQSVAKCGSFSAAAHELNYAQSNISTKIQQLEGELNTTLFFRHNRGIALTPKGTLLLDYAEKILQLVDETSTAMLEDGVARGPLALGSMETTAAVYLPKLLASYHKANPLVQLSLTTGTTTDNLERVLSRELDAAFVAGPVNHPELTQQFFTTEDLVLVAGKSEMAEELSSWRDLERRTLLVFPYGCYYRKILEQLFQQEGVIPEQIIEFNSLGAILASVCAGLGMSLLPASVVRPYLADNIMSSFPIPQAYTAISTVLVYRKDHFMNTAFHEFLKTVREQA